MESTQLKLETVTPMFLHGPDSEKLELRPPPFRALFRYWWRATVGEKDEDKLREREGNLFGNTKKRSPLSVCISGSGPLPAADDRAPLPHSRNFMRQAYLPNGRFNLTLAAPQLGQYEEIAEISFLLGGVGNRSRRGFGSIRYQSGWGFQTVTHLQEKVSQVLDRISPKRFHFHKETNTIQINPAITLPDYPVIQAIHFAINSVAKVDKLLLKIGQVTSTQRAARNDAVGSADPRMASPLVVRVHKIDNGFIPIVTQLHSVFPGPIPANYKQKQQDFINAVIT